LHRLSTRRTGWTVPCSSSPQRRRAREVIMTAPPNVAVLLLILLCTPPGLATAQVPETCADLPPNLIVRDGYAPHVRRLIVRSPTIRAQCRALAATPRAIVVVRLPQGPRLLDCRARATIRRTAAGTIRAVIEIPPVSGDFAGLLAHELEHVMEQIDGIDLAARAGDGRSGVRRGRQGAFETDRAQRAGLAAAREVFMSAR
jgi:hypothetical protein